MHRIILCFLIFLVVGCGPKPGVVTAFKAKPLWESTLEAENFKAYKIITSEKKIGSVVEFPKKDGVMRKVSRVEDCTGAFEYEWFEATLMDITENIDLDTGFNAKLLKQFNKIFDLEAIAKTDVVNTVNVDYSNAVSADLTVVAINKRLAGVTDDLCIEAFRSTSVPRYVIHHELVTNGLTYTFTSDETTDQKILAEATETAVIDASRVSNVDGSATFAITDSPRAIGFRLSEIEEDQEQGGFRVRELSLSEMETILRSQGPLIPDPN